MESFKPGENRLAQNPGLVATQEDRFHNSLVEFCTNSWRRILLAQHLANSCTHPTSLANLASHGLDVIIIMQEQAAEVSKHLDLLQHVPIHGELLS